MSVEVVVGSDIKKWLDTAILEDRYISEEHDTTTLYFSLPSDVLEGKYPEAESAELSIEYPSASPYAENATIMISPTKNTGSEISDYDWQDVSLDMDIVQRLINKAEKEKTEMVDYASEKEQKYEQYKLQWMLDHGYTLKDLIAELEKLRQESDPDMNLESLFKDWEFGYGFGSEVWPCFGEYLNAEGKNKPPFGTVLWCDEDIATQLIERGYDPSEDNIAIIRTACENDHHFTDGITAAGWDAIDAKIDECCDSLNRDDKPSTDVPWAIERAASATENISAVNFDTELGCAELGCINIESGHVIVTDPCYNSDANGRVCNVPVAPGDYDCTVWFSDEGECGVRVESLSIWQGGAAAVAEGKGVYENIGEIGVDSGLAGIFEKKPDFTDEQWSKFCDVISIGDAWIVKGLEVNGVLSSSGFGDGCYGVYGHRKPGASVYDGIVIVFIEHEEDEDDVDDGDF